MFILIFRIDLSARFALTVHRAEGQKRRFILRRRGAAYENSLSKVSRRTD